MDANELAKQLRRLRQIRAERKKSHRLPRASLSRAERSKVRAKTGGRCHLCGEVIEGEDWQADHVLAHAIGGDHKIDNYLPAHRDCNRDRWHFSAKEFQWIIKLGVYLRMQIEKENPAALAIAEKFCMGQKRSAARRKVHSS
jgi:hypothetical protein